MKPVFIASTPNSQKDDRKIARKMLFKPTKWKRGKACTVAHRRISELLDLKYVYTYNTGRASLYSIFKSLGLKPDSEIIIQAFTCLAVPLSIKWAKCKPVFVDIEKNFNPSPQSIKSAITPKTRAVIIQHTFGISPQIDEIQKIIEEENKNRTEHTKIYLIEDLAHSLGSTYKGKKLGTFGDIAMMSFGQEKMVSCTQGGGLATNDEKIARKLSVEYEKLDYTSRFTAFRNIIHPLLWNLINKTYYFPPKISVGKGLILLFRVLGLLRNHADPNSDISDPDIAKLSNAQCTMLLNQLNKFEELNNHRKTITRIYNENLPKNYQLGIEGPLLRYPIVCKEREDIIYKLKSHRIIPGNWYSAPIHPPETDQQLFGYKAGSCPNVEKLSKKVINLPTSINVSENQAKTISSLLH